MNGQLTSLKDTTARFASLDLWLYIAILQVAIAIMRGFSDASSSRLAVIEGMISAFFWLVAAILPLMSDVRKSNEPVLDALNAIAAGATGAAVMCATGSGWLLVLGILPGS